VGSGGGGGGGPRKIKKTANDAAFSRGVVGYGMVGDRRRGFGTTEGGAVEIEGRLQGARPKDKKNLKQISKTKGIRKK